MWGESTGQLWIPLTKVCDAELWICFYLRLWTEQTIDTPVIWDAIDIFDNENKFSRKITLLHGKQPPGFVSKSGQTEYWATEASKSVNNVTQWIVLKYTSIFENTVISYFAD